MKNVALDLVNARELYDRIRKEENIDFHFTLIHYWIRRGMPYHLKMPGGRGHYLFNYPESKKWVVKYYKTPYKRIKNVK